MNGRISTFVGREGDTLLKTLFRHAPQTDTVFLGQTTPSLLAGHEDDPLTQTAEFRRCLQEYTAAHPCGVLCEEKSFFWHLSPDGRFCAQLLIEGDFTELFCLSGNEQKHLKTLDGIY